ncbi:5-hydroxytryptamine receptor 1B-like [Paramacrobiotus metropolitanus]|uniref:5-hydroxytryptamine receptor 1B-like n=1 Tax=Paramacrobiotus metropolitanus TaxID=2943436 RepID=UPI002445EF95|nr:5-hydroxytryptamine receptor 1B-like [Paramacrobiotus metropolitanus]
MDNSTILLLINSSLIILNETQTNHSVVSVINVLEGSPSKILLNATHNTSAVISITDLTEKSTSRMVLIVSRFGGWTLLNVTSLDLLDTLPATWDAIPILAIIVMILTLSLNILLLILLTRRRLRTSFTVYLGVLCITNIIFSILNNPFDILVEVYGKWPYTSGVCDLYLYGSFIVCSITMHCHALITGNRLWAISFPLHYKNHHSRAVAAGACIVVAVYVHACLIPFLVLDSLYYRYPVGEIVVGCTPNVAAQQKYSIVVQTLLFDLPIAFIVAAYPFLWYKHKKLHRISDHHSTPKDESETSRRGGEVVTHVTAKKNRRSFLVLTLLTGSIFLCWTTAQVYDTVDCFYDVQRSEASEQQTLILIREIGELIYSAQAALDPILFIVALKDLREALVKMLRGEKH